MWGRWGGTTLTWSSGDTEIRWRGTESDQNRKKKKKKQGRWGEERGKDQSWKTKSQVARGVADFRVCASHVACDSMQGLTRSARGTDGPTQQYLCMHVCAFRLHAFLNMICSSAYWPLQVKGENCSCNLIIYHKLPAKDQHNSPSTPTQRCRYTLVHINRPHGGDCILAAGLAAACRELCYVTYGANIEHVIVIMQTETLGVLCSCGTWV